MRLPNNLSQPALVDYRRALKRSRDEFGDEQALRMRDRLVIRFHHIAGGIAAGHKHAFAGVGTRPILCLTVAPLLIFYDADTRDILRIVDGRRDLTALFDEGA